MISLEFLGMINARLREIFLVRRTEHFGGVSMIIIGDFCQLPLVGVLPLYTKSDLRGKRQTHLILGRQAWNNAFRTTVTLGQVVRQAGNDPIAVVFREALSQLRVGGCT